MPDATIDRAPTGRVSATITNGAPDATIDRAPTGRVTARLHISEPGE